MTNRDKEILNGLVAAFINTGEPVGSSYLAKKLGLNISPATIRSALQKLDEAGYIYQPHTSAGRVPTDRGYRFYVDQITAQGLPPAEQEKIRRVFERLYGEYHHRARSATKLLAEMANTVAVGIAPQTSDIQEAGMTELLDSLDQSDLDTAREVSVIIDLLDHAVPELAKLAKQGATVFIGNENPLLKARHTSLLIKSVTLSDGRSFLLIVTGPKRMSYQRNLNLLDYVADLI